MVIGKALYGTVTAILRTEGTMAHWLIGAKVVPKGINLTLLSANA